MWMRRANSVLLFHPSPPAVFQLDLIETSSLSPKAVSRREMEWFEVDPEAIASLGRVLASFSRCLTSFIVKVQHPAMMCYSFEVGTNL